MNYEAYNMDSRFQKIAGIVILHCLPSFQTIRARILEQYEATQQDHDFQRKKKRYNYLHEKLTHIKRLVRDYDSTPPS